MTMLVKQCCLAYWAVLIDEEGLKDKTKERTKLKDIQKSLRIPKV